MRIHLDVMVWRGSIAESCHHFDVAACDADGKIQMATETPDRVTTFRSAAKPFQLLPLVERGHAKRWGFGDEQLAVMASSHTGSPRHVELVSGILERLGLSAQDLACGFHEPLDADSRAHLRDYPESRSALYNNCSGKHAGMLCLALSEGWPIQGYERPDHPVQRLMHATVAEVAGVRQETVATAIDGCSVATFALPLDAMARAYARLAGAKPDGDVREQALRRIRGAMRSYPDAAGGAERFSTVLMQRAQGLVAKGGAEGLECVGCLESGLGIAVKCEDGTSRGVGPAVIAILEQLGALSPEESASLEAWRRPTIENHAGLEVGHLEATLSVKATA